MNTLALDGCAPVPLAHYLKALGVLRIVSEQMNESTRAAWHHDRILLNSTLNEVALVKFFAQSYQPTPVLAPWNGGSGFFPKDNSEALSAIETGSATRLRPYCAGIAAARLQLSHFRLKAKPEGGTKSLLLQSCRNSFPEDALRWLDAVFVLGEGGPEFPPLLGTGGNDGRFEFTNNFMQRIVEVMDPATGEPAKESEPWLRAALFGDAAPELTIRAPIGQFFPGAAGGANATSGFDAAAAVNPWDFILMIEGALLFAAASVRRMETTDDSRLAYPFCVRQVGAGYASASGADETESRCEMWMPLWTEPTTLAELSAIFGEGRAQVRGRAACTGIDFAEAAVTLGVDRGISAFQRYGFQVRNGLSYFATPLDRVAVHRNFRADLLADIEQWHDRLRQKAGPRANPEPPASVARALNQLESHIFQLCRDRASTNLQALLTVLGETERALARSFNWSAKNYIHPLRGLRPNWLEKAYDNSPEFRLAQSLAGMRAWCGNNTLWFREHLEPLRMGANRDRSWVEWADQSTNDVAWHDGDLADVFNAILARRLVRAQQAGVNGWPDWSPRPARLADITDFIEGRINETLLADLIWGLSAVDWERVIREESRSVAENSTEHTLPTRETSAAENGDSNAVPGSADSEQRVVPSSFYALLRLCLRRADSAGEHKAVPLVPAIFYRAMNGQGKEASILAARRLRSSGMAPLVNQLPVSGDIARRTAAALLFPIAPRDFRLLERTILKPINTQNT